MAIRNPTDLKAILSPGQRLLGLDVGSKTIGLALCDVNLWVASALSTIARTKFAKDMDALSAIIDAHNVGGLVIGLPVSMDGTEGPRAQSTRQFAANVLGRRDIAIAFWDERMSTMAVNRLLIEEADMSRKRRSEVVDKMAAAYILQGALDFLARATPPPLSDSQDI